MDILGWDRYHINEHKNIHVSFILQEGQWKPSITTETRERASIINQTPIQQDGIQD